jgi:hypothetical protein
MARWSDRYFNAVPIADTVDTVDTVAALPACRIHSVNSVNSVTAAASVGKGNQVANDVSVTIPCSRCGARSGTFIEVINPDLWQCATCLPADPNDQAYEAIERVAIMTEANPAAPILHHMPVSWSDATITPTPGARCRCCSGNRWWCERDQPDGWRCAQCHPGNHLSADRRRDVVT